MPAHPDTSAVTYHDDVPLAAFLLPLGTGLLVFLWPTLTGLARVYRTDGNFSHGFLVPLISLYAVWCMRAELRPRFSVDGGLIGFPLIFGGVLLILLSRWYELALLPRGVIAMFTASCGGVVLLAGLGWVALGRARVRRLLFPLGFLLLAVPIPSFLLNRITLPLQGLAARLSCAALHLVGVAVERQGHILRFETGTLGVAEACSGIRSLAVLTAVVLAMIHFQRLRRWVSAALLVAIVPAAVLGNVIRVFVSGVFYARGWKQLAHGAPHELLGLLTFGIAIAMIIGLGSLLTRGNHGAMIDSETGHGEETGRGGSGDTARVQADPAGMAALANPAFCVAFLLFAGAGLSFFVGSHYDRLHATALASLGERLPLARFPAAFGGYVRVSSEALSDGEFRLLDPSDSTIGTYRAPDGRRIHLTALYGKPPAGRPSQRPDLLKRPHSPDWCFPAAGWRRLRQFEQNRQFDVFPGEVGGIRLFERDGARQVLVFWTGITAARTDSPDQMVMRLRDMIRSWNHPPLANLHTLTLGVDAGDDPAAARDAALRFAEALYEILPAYGIGGQ